MGHNKNVLIRTKLINSLIKHGKKNVSEKILLRSLKELLKASNKQFTEVFKLFLVFSVSPFKLHVTFQKNRKKVKNYKPTELNAFVLKRVSRISLTIKRLIADVPVRKRQKMHHRFRKEILLRAQFKEEPTNLKNSLQKQVFTNKHFFSYFKWQ